MYLFSSVKFHGVDSQTGNHVGGPRVKKRGRAGDGRPWGDEGKASENEGALQSGSIMNVGHMTPRKEGVTVGVE